MPWTTDICATAVLHGSQVAMTRPERTDSWIIGAGEAQSLIGVYDAELIYTTKELTPPA